MPTPRTPRAEELPRLAAFLPTPPTVRYQIAAARAEPSPERIVGAAAWWPAQMEGTALCCWHVTPRWEADGQTLPAELLDALVADAAEGGVSSLYTAAMLPEDSPIAALLLARGWTVASRNEFFEGSLEDVGTRLDVAYQRIILAREGVVATTRVRSSVLTPELLPAVHALVTSKALVSSDELSYRLNHLDAPGGYSRLGSSVLLAAHASPAVAAVVLLRLDASTAEFDARVADPLVCASAGVSVPLANLLLLRASLLRLRGAGGGGRIRFRAHPQDHRETANFARRCGARLIGASCTWRYQTHHQGSHRPGSNPDL